MRRVNAADRDAKYCQEVKAEGYDAAERGYDWTDNPYCVNSEEAKLWDNGWLEFKEADRKCGFAD